MTKTLQVTRGDVVIRQSAGQLASIEDRAKARQSLQRLIALDSPWGAGLNELVGTVPQSPLVMSARIQARVRDAFTGLVTVEVSTQRADRTDEERLTQIRRMRVQSARLSDSPSETGYFFRVDAVTAAGEIVDVASVIAES